MDLIERLRLVVKNDGAPEWYWDHPDTLRNPDGPEAADEIERLLTNQSIIITLFRIYMIRLDPNYSEEEFDKHIANMLEEKE
jgi:hypothetical protein